MILKENNQLVLAKHLLMNLGFTVSGSDKTLTDVTERLTELGARIWKGAKKAWQERMPNVAFLRTRIEFINSFFGQGEVEEIWLTFPDPQLKKRRRKKRLTSARFLGSYQDFLKDRGIIHLKTDSEELYRYTLEMIKLNGLHVVFSTDDLYGHQHMDKVYGIRTFYENRFIEQEKKICFLEFELPRDKIIQEPDFPEEDNPEYLESESGTKQKK